MGSEFSREIRKLEVRLEDYMKAEQEFVENVKECIRVFGELMKNLEKRSKTSSSKEIEKLSLLKKEAVKSLSQVLKSEGNIEHEKSHLLESYGALILCLDEEFEKAQS
jgi:glutaminase